MLSASAFVLASSAGQTLQPHALDATALDATATDARPNLQPHALDATTTDARPNLLFFLVDDAGYPENDPLVRDLDRLIQAAAAE